MPSAFRRVTGSRGIITSSTVRDGRALIRHQQLELTKQVALGRCANPDVKRRSIRGRNKLTQRHATVVEQLEEYIVPRV